MKNHFLWTSLQSPLRFAAIILAGTALCACSSTPNKGVPPPPPQPVNNPFNVSNPNPGTPPNQMERHRQQRENELNARQLYQQGHQQILDANYAGAAKTFNKVISRFPFTRYATQAQLEQIYADYRSFQLDAAGAEANQFLREHPRHPNADYALYLEGLIAQARDQSLLQHLPIDTTQFDTGNMQRAFQDFTLLLRRYPDSRYANDARLRMIYLRDRLADHQLGIVRFYIRRGAWLAAAKRAQEVIADYPGAPATVKALFLLKHCYVKLGLKDQEQQVETLIKANARSIAAAEGKGSQSATKAPSRNAADATPPTLPATSTSTPGTSNASSAKSDQQPAADNSDLRASDPHQSPKGAS